MDWDRHTNGGGMKPAKFAMIPHSPVFVHVF